MKSKSLMKAGLVAGLFISTVSVHAASATTSVCGPDLQYAQQIAQSFLDGSFIPYGYKIVAQCSLNWQYQNYCMSPGLS